MIERRKHKRYPMPRGTFGIFRKEMEQLCNHERMSIGEIAMVLYKSESQLLGQVANMSYGGIAFENGAYNLPSSGRIELDLLMTEQGIYLHNIPYKAVTKKASKKIKVKTSASTRAVLQFKKLDPALKKKLRELMACHV